MVSFHLSITLHGFHLLSLEVFCASSWLGVGCKFLPLASSKYQWCFPIYFTFKSWAYIMIIHGACLTFHFTGLFFGRSLWTPQLLRKQREQLSSRNTRNLVLWRKAIFQDLILTNLSIEKKKKEKLPHLSITFMSPSFHFQYQVCWDMESSLFHCYGALVALQSPWICTWICITLSRWVSVIVNSEENILQNKIHWELSLSLSLCRYVTDVVPAMLISMILFVWPAEMPDWICLTKGKRKAPSLALVNMQGIVSQ